VPPVPATVAAPPAVLSAFAPCLFFLGLPGLLASSPTVRRWAAARRVSA